MQHTMPLVRYQENNMGMYTEFHFNVQLKKDVSEQVVNVLNKMLGEDVDVSLPEHELFITPRWEIMLRCDSYYFDAQTHSALIKDKFSEGLYLCIRCNLKNYDSEIEKFVDWIKPHIDGYEGKFLGFSRYEETEEPTLIYM